LNNFIVSDFHFFHTNILKYCNRPFKDVNEMNEQIIKRHNERVKKEDTVYFLGDFGFFASSNRAFRGEGQPYDPDKILNQMNGKWMFVKGNHDKKSNKFYPKADTIILNQNGLRIQLIHDPMYAKIDYDLILCGHVHNNYKAKELHYCGQTRLIINVSVDVWNFYPVKLDEILAIYYRWKNERDKINRWDYPQLLKELNKNTLNQTRE
jgi:calcineurin-like phosphoesterase family protein